MLWNHRPQSFRGLPWPGSVDPLRELDRIQSEVARLFGPIRRAARASEFPPVRVSTGDEGALLEALVPGVDPAQLEITVRGDTLFLKGERPAAEQKDGSTWHRNERRTGSFARTVTLPFEIEAEEVEARFDGGVLEVKLPRVASQRPRKIPIATS